MSKLLVCIFLLLISLVLANPSVVTATSLTLNLSTPNPVEASVISLTYQGFDPGNCFVLYVQKENGDYIRPTPSPLTRTPPCFKGLNTYLDYISSQASNTIDLEPLPAGNYSAYTRQYNLSCTPLRIRCSWNSLEKTSNTLRFTVEPTTLDSPLTNPSVVTATGLTLNLSTPNPVEASVISLTYQGFDPGNCLVLYVQNDRSGTPAQPTHPSITPSCSKLRSTYLNYISSQTRDTINVEPQSAGNYSAYVQQFNQSSCPPVGPIRTICPWTRLTKTSKILSFTVQPTTLDYSLALIVSPSSGKAGDTFKASITLTSSSGAPVAGHLINIDNSGSAALGTGNTDVSGLVDIDITSRVGDLPRGPYTIRAITWIDSQQISGTSNLTVTQEKYGLCTIDLDNACTALGKKCDAGRCVNTKSLSTLIREVGTCIPGDPDPLKKCTSGSATLCPGTTDSVSTAIGCIPTNPVAFVNTILRFSIAIGGGIAFILMIFGAFQMITSAGNPEALQNGRSRLTDAVIGLLVLILSVLILQIIGVDILKLPGFGK